MEDVTGCGFSLTADGVYYQDYEAGRSKITGDIVELTLPTHLEDISSTRIRSNIDENRDISNLIDPVVQSFIYDNALYMRQPMYKRIVEAGELDFHTELTDGTLRLGLTVSLEDEEQMEYLFVPAQEAETEAVTE